jgi:hypothetical protein
MAKRSRIRAMSHVFERASSAPHSLGVVILLERIRNQQVAGSIPAGGFKF